MNQLTLRRMASDAILFGFNQGWVQLVSLISGFMVVQLLPKDEYARLTLALTGLTILNVLADSGVGTALKSLGQQNGPESVAPDHLLASALRTRRMLFACAIPLVSIYLTVLLIENNTSHLGAAMLLIVVIATAAPTLRYQTIKTILLVRHSTTQIKNVEAKSSIARLIVYGAALLAAPTSLAILLATAVVSAWQARTLTLCEISTAVSRAPRLPDLDRQMRSIVRRLLPNCLFFCIQGQLGYVLLSFWSNTSAVADAGALARLAVVYAILTTPFTSVVALRITADLGGSLARWYGIVLLAAFGVALVPSTLVAFWPHAFLFPLGPAYAHLTHEAVLIAAVGTTTMMAGTMLTLNEVRGWVKLYGLYYVPLTAGLMVVVAVAMDPAKVGTAVILSGAAPLTVVILGAGDAILGIRKMKFRGLDGK